jgi:hypothetical protein
MSLVHTLNVLVSDVSRVSRLRATRCQLLVSF